MLLWRKLIYLLFPSKKKSIQVAFKCQNNNRCFVILKWAWEIHVACCNKAGRNRYPYKLTSRLKDRNLKGLLTYQLWSWRTKNNLVYRIFINRCIFHVWREVLFLPAQGSQLDTLTPTSVTLDHVKCNMQRTFLGNELMAKERHWRLIHI